MNSSSFNPSSFSLLSRVRLNDQSAWSQLVEMYGPLVVHWCRQHQLGTEDAADVTQQVFMAVSRGLEQFSPQSGVSRNPDGSFRAWLWVITRNKIRDWARQQPQDQSQGGSSIQIRLEQLPELEDEPTSPEIMDQVLQIALRQIQSQFQSQTWEAFWLCVVEGQTTDVVADRLKLTPANVRQARSRVLRRLREQLGDRDD